MYLGADGCKAGWAVAAMDGTGCFTQIHVAKDFASVLLLAERLKAVSLHVDIPIGLSDTENGRAPDRAAKRFSVLGHLPSFPFRCAPRSTPIATPRLAT